MRTVDLHKIRNVRDLGGIPVHGNRLVTFGRIYRGSALYECPDEDAHVLFDELGISCVIDLRCGWEVEARPNRVPAYIDQFHIPFYDLEKVGIEYTRSVAGTKAIGHDIACDPLHFYRSLSNRLTAGQMRAALDLVFDQVSNGRSVYFHCSGGKDRAGILAALILQVLGASDEHIMEDYVATNISRDKDCEQVYQRFLRLADGDAKLAKSLVISHRANAENLLAFYESAVERYGGMDAFFRDILGMTEERCESFRRICTQDIQERELSERELSELRGCA